MFKLIISLSVILGFVQVSYAHGNSVSLGFNYSPTTTVVSQPSPYQGYYPQTSYPQVNYYSIQPSRCMIPHLYGTTYVYEQGGYVPITDQFGRVVGYECR